MPDRFDVSGRAVVVTGSSRGLGLEIARQFLAAGARVVINGVDAEEAEQARHTLGRDPSRLRCVVGDVSTPSTAADLVDTALDAFTRLDHVVCNAGVVLARPAVEISPVEWDTVLAVNLRGAFLTAQAAARRWTSLGLPGSVTMTSSITGSAGVANLAAYAASKGGLDQLTRTLAVEWAGQDIRVNAVALGHLETAGPAPSPDPVSALTPMGRRASLEEAAAPFLFLASPAAAYVTGSVLAVDGGYTSR